MKKISEEGKPVYDGPIIDTFLHSLWIGSEGEPLAVVFDSNFFNLSIARASDAAS